MRVYTVLKNKMSANFSNDLSDLCRVCLQLPEESQYLDLTTIYDEEDSLTYAECFTICTQIDLNAGEGLPHHLCKSCGLELQMSYDFYKKVEESKRVIEQRLEAQKEDATEFLADIKQCQNQNSNKKSTTVIGKYVLTDDEEQLPGPSEETDEDCLMKSEYEQQYLAPTDETETVNIICDTESDALHQVSADKNSSNLEALTGNNVTIDVADHLEMEDYQNLEELEEEARGRKACLKIKKEIIDEEQCSKDEFKTQCKNISAQALVNHNVQDIVEIKKEILKEYIYTPNGRDTADGENANEGMNPLENKNNTNEIKIENEYLELNTTALQDLIPLNNLSPLDVQLDSRYRETPFECEFCGHCLPTKNALYKHRLRKHKNEKCFHRNLLGTPLDCPQCSRVFKTMDSLRKHIDAKHSHKHFVCEHCDHKLPTKNALCQHRLRKHRDIEKGKKKVLKFKCPLCTETFPTSESLNLHKSSAHVKKPIMIEGKAWFQCEYCGHKLPTKNALCQHRLRKHRNKKNAKSSYRCVYCEIVVPSHERLQKHVLESHEALPALKQLVERI